MKLTKGADLTGSQRAEVLRRYVHRYTGQHKPRWALRPMPNGKAYEPTHATDAAWVADHAFYIRSDGGIAERPRHCEPAFMVG